MLDGVYVETKEERRIVALKPKPAFKALFQIATTKEGSGIILYNEKVLASSESPDDLCSWWRRGRVELPVHQLWDFESLKKLVRTWLLLFKKSIGRL